MVFSQKVAKRTTLHEVIDNLSLHSSAAQIEKLNFQSGILQFENYKKSYLPAFSLNFNPVNFNRSLRMLQHSTDGSYSYVEDYSNNSSAGVSVRQKIGFTGGEINIGSDINYLNEFSRKRNSFSTTPFSIGYSQQLLGGGKHYRLEKEIEYAKNKVAIKEYCTKLSQIQQQALGFYMTALLGKMEQNLALKTTQNTDTLLQLARIKLDNGHITEYDLKQIELQSLNAQYAFENACKNYIEAQEPRQTNPYLNGVSVNGSTVSTGILTNPPSMIYETGTNPLGRASFNLSQYHGYVEVKVYVGFSYDSGAGHSGSSFSKTIYSSYRE